MALYEYEHLSPSDCEIKELYQNINDPALEICPKCKSPIRRIMSIPSRPLFKGSGFYETDYKNGGNK